VAHFIGPICLSCGWRDGLDLGRREMCPMRYLSPHTEEHDSRVTEVLMVRGQWTTERSPTPAEHLRAIRRAIAAPDFPMLAAW
jgi:hypothetical protein